MNYIHYPFQANQGDIVEVDIDRAANVQLLDSANFENYKNRKTYDHLGGPAEASPVRLTVPSEGTWHVVVDLGGGPGQVRATAELISNAEA